MKNKYINHSHLSESEFENLVRCFANEMPSLQIAAETGLNRNTVNRIVGLIRHHLVDLQKGSVIVPRNLHLESVKFAFRAMAVTPSLNSAREQIRVAILNTEGSIHCEVVSSDTIPDQSACSSQSANAHVTSPRQKPPRRLRQNSCQCMARTT